MESGIYSITNILNNHVYVGMAQNIQHRWKQHKNNYLNENCKEYNKALYKAFRKYGIVNFSFTVLEYCEKEKLRSKELYWIEKLNALQYYNERNGWQPEISAFGESHPNHKLTEYDVIDIRTRYNNLERCKDVEKLYKNKINHSGFVKIWKGETWKHIMPEVFTEKNKNFHLHNTGNSGSNNGRANFNEEMVYSIRLRKKMGEKRLEVYKDYCNICSEKYFQSIWYGYNWKHVIIK